MSLPEGFRIPGREHEVCKLKKYIFGLKKVPRCWNEKFNEFITSFGLKKSSYDLCVYYRHKAGELTIAAIFVDDWLICSTNQEVLDEIGEHLAKHFAMRTSQASIFLGLEIMRNRDQK